MKKIILISLLSFLFSNAMATCIDCTELANAKENPQKVTTLSLVNQSISSIDESFNAFSNLKTLRIVSSGLNEIDSRVKMPSVEHLDLSHNQFNAWKINDLIQAFPNLKTLDLSYNSLIFMGSNCSGLTQLEALNLSHNYIKALPAEIKGFINLKRLDISYNLLLTGTENIGYLWNLEALNIQGNKDLTLTQILEPILVNNKLSELLIDGDHFTTKELSDLSLLPNISVTLNSNPLSPSVQYIKPFKFKTLEHVNFTDPKKNIKYGDSHISKFILTNSIVPPITCFTKVPDTIQLNSALPAYLENLYAYKKLAVLDVQNMELSAAQLENLKKNLPKTVILQKEQFSTESMLENKVTPLAEIKGHISQINTNTPQVIQEKNVSLEVPKEAFLTKTGEVYSGNATLSLKVYENPVVNALVGAPMTFNSQNGQTELFASNGMFEIQVKDDKGNELLPNPANPIQAVVSDLNPTQTGGLYSFDSTTRQWKTLTPSLAPNVQVNRIAQIIDSINRISADSLLSRLDIEPAFELRFTPSKTNNGSLKFHLLNGKELNTKQPLLYKQLHVLKGIENKTWLIDTVLSDEARKNLIEIDTFFKVNSSFLQGTFSPRILNSISLVPDVKNDNFRLTFKIKDSLVSLPVYLEGSTNKESQKITLKHIESQIKAYQRDEKDELAMQKFIKYNSDSVVAQIRRTMIQNAIRQANLTPFSPIPTPNQIRFGLTLFGLINCDYFFRQTPETQILVRSTLYDQNGKSFKNPNTVRLVNNNQNIYGEFSCKERIPGFANSVLIFDFGKNLIGITKTNADARQQITSVITLDIANLSAEEIAQKITQF